MEIWIVNSVKRGFIEGPEVFLEKELALERFEVLSRDLNPDYDELELFEKIIED